MSLSDCRVLEIPCIADERGNLAVVERDSGFEIRRVYWLYDVPAAASRAGHAHRTLRQLIVAVSGSCDVTLDDGSARRTFRLDRPDRGLYVHPMTWRELDAFSAGTVLVVLASAPYDEADYYREYDAFLPAARAT